MTRAVVACAWIGYGRGTGFELTVHAPGVRDGDIVVVATEGSLAAVMNGRQSASAAFDRGLIAIDREAPARDVTQRPLMAALDSAAASGSTTDGAHNPPMRCFGPRP